MTKAEDKAARILGAKGGKARARRLTPEQRSESARKAAKARWDAQGALQRVRDAIEKIKSGNLDLMRARMIRQIMNYQVQVAALSVRAERSGIESDFFNLHVDRSGTRRGKRWSGLRRNRRSSIPRGAWATGSQLTPPPS